MNIELLQQLCEASAVSGDEQEVREHSDKHAGTLRE